ncbi:MAG: glycosyltransferase family 9 protein, partial [Victivallaceae bacterium]
GIFKFEPQEDDVCCQLPVYPAVATTLQQTAEKMNLDLTQSFMAVIPGARWLSKRFPAKLFAEVILQLAEKNLKLNFVIAGSPDEMPEATAIVNLLPESLRSRTYVLTGKTSIPELFELLRLSQVVLCNDSGPMHIAAALNKPVAALFGPTIPEKTGPYGRQCRFFQCDINCLKCMKRECPLPEINCHKLKSSEISDYINKIIGCN